MDKASYDPLLRSLVNTISDYRQGEIAPITPKHVENWLTQFDAEDQYIILYEMDRMMKRLYLSKARVKDHLRTFLKQTIIGSGNAIDILSKTRFLDIQTIGDSQRALLATLNEILQEDYNIQISDCGQDEIATYIYIDDAIYTGNRLLHDFIGTGKNGWLINEAPYNCKVAVYFLAAHQQGLNYVLREIYPYRAQKSIVLVPPKWSIFIDNSRNSKIQYLWPEKPPASQEIDKYVHNLQLFAAQHGQPKLNLFRDNTIPKKEEFFSSPEARRVVEQAFLKYGVKIATASKEPAIALRPLGYTKFTSLGFGTLFITYRNISNNCPLVLWWGDKTMPTGHPFSIWEPLFPRMTNKLREPSQYDITEEHPF